MMESRNLEDWIHIFIFIILFFTALASLVYLILLYSGSFERKEAVENFCEDKGMNIAEDYRACWRIEGDFYIKREVKVIEGKAYWKTKLEVENEM